MRAVPLLVVAVALAACTRVIDISGVEWRRSDAGIQQVTFDEVACARATTDAGDLRDTIVGGIADAVVVLLEDARRGAAYDRCMSAKGYTKVVQR